MRGSALLSNLPKLCDCLGSTSSEGCAAVKINDVILMRFEYYRIISLLAWYRAINHRDDIAKEVVSELKLLGGDRKFKARELEEVMKSTLKDIPGDAHSPLLEDDEAVACRT